MDKCPSKWPWLNQIGHIEWIGFSQIDHPDLTFSQINHYDLTFIQMNHTHLMT
jgi:predicted aldo/keto reductase-like oxidoreductase